MHWNTALSAQKMPPERPFGGKCNVLVILGTIRGSIGIFLGHFGSHFGIKNHKKGMSKASQMEPGSQTPPWDALGSILGSFWVDFGHRFWTKKQLKIYEETCSQKVCENMTKMTSKLSNKSIK